MHPPNHKKEQVFFPAEMLVLHPSFYGAVTIIEMGDGENVLFLKSYLPVCAGFSPDHA